ncbi:MAG: hypothetical protein NVV74_19420 [Magnetospirillum sp.]|nr:hypothetical protein [Magnetospirillum sp.]
MAALRQGVIALAILLAMCAAAGAQSCPPSERAPEVRIAAELPPPSYRNSLTRPRIGALSGDGHMSSDRTHAGLTQTRTDFSVRPTLSFQRLSGGRVCASLKSLEASWRMVTFQVDVAAEYRPGTCQHTEVLRHENQHVAIAQRAFTLAERSLRADLQELARRTQPFVIRGTPAQAADEMARRFMAAGRPALERYQRDTERENRAIDTPEGYRAVTARCQNW